MADGKSSHVCAEGDEADCRVFVSTIHRAKGLEWDYGFVCGMVKGAMPHIFPGKKPNFVEQRNLLYVAASRFKKCVMFSSYHYADPMYGGNGKYTVGSTYLYDIPEVLLARMNKPRAHVMDSMF